MTSLPKIKIPISHRSGSGGGGGNGGRKLVSDLGRDCILDVDSEIIDDESISTISVFHFPTHASDSDVASGDVGLTMCRDLVYLTDLQTDFFLADAKLWEFDGIKLVLLLFTAADRTTQGTGSRLVFYKIEQTVPASFEFFTQTEWKQVYYRIQVSRHHICLAGRDSVHLISNPTSRGRNILTNTVGYKYVNLLKLDEFGLFLSHSRDLYLTSWTFLNTTCC